MTDTVIPNAEIREAARDLIASLTADGCTDLHFLAELQKLADGQPMPKQQKAIKWKTNLSGRRVLSCA